MMIVIAPLVTAAIPRLLSNFQKQMDIRSRTRRKMASRIMFSYHLKATEQIKGLDYYYRNFLLAHLNETTCRAISLTKMCNVHCKIHSTTTFHVFIRSGLTTR